MYLYIGYLTFVLRLKTLREAEAHTASQGRVSDHRINLTLYNLSEVLEGGLDDLVIPLSADDESKRLAELNNE